MCANNSWAIILVYIEADTIHFYETKSPWNIGILAFPLASVYNLKTVQNYWGKICSYIVKAILSSRCQLQEKNLVELSSENAGL